MSYTEAFLKANIQSLIALIIISGGLYGLLFNSSGTDIKIAIVGLMTMVLQYYFGNSKGSSDKDKTISNMTEQK